LQLPAEGHWLDVDAFRQAASASAFTARQDALALYRGDLLAAF
jgi:hypothetical protein